MLSRPDLNRPCGWNVSCWSDVSLRPYSLILSVLPCLGICPWCSLTSLPGTILIYFLISLISLTLTSLISSRPVQIPHTSDRPYRPHIGLGSVSGWSTVIMSQVIFLNTTNINLVIWVNFNCLVFDLVKCLLYDDCNWYCHFYDYDDHQYVKSNFCHLVKLNITCLCLQYDEKRQYQYNRC